MLRRVLDAAKGDQPLEESTGAVLLAMVVVWCLGSCDESAKSQRRQLGRASIDFCEKTISVTATEVYRDDVMVSDASALNALTNLKDLWLSKRK